MLPEKVWVCGIPTVRESSVSYLASLLVHESVHCAKLEQGSWNEKLKDEPEAYHTQMSFLKKYGEKNEYEYVKRLIREKHWKRNFVSVSKSGKITPKNNVRNFYKKHSNFFDSSLK